MPRSFRLFIQRPSSYSGTLPPNFAWQSLYQTLPFLALQADLGPGYEHGPVPEGRRNGRVAHEICHTERRADADELGLHDVTAVWRSSAVLGQLFLQDCHRLVLPAHLLGRGGFTPLVQLQEISSEPLKPLSKCRSMMNRSAVMIGSAKVFSSTWSGCALQYRWSVLQGGRIPTGPLGARVRPLGPDRRVSSGRCS